MQKENHSLDIIGLFQPGSKQLDQFMIAGGSYFNNNNRDVNENYVETMLVVAKMCKLRDSNLRLETFEVKNSVLNKDTFTPQFKKVVELAHDQLVNQNLNSEYVFQNAFRQSRIACAKICTNNTIDAWNDQTRERQALGAFDNLRSNRYENLPSSMAELKKEAVKQIISGEHNLLSSQSLKAGLESEKKAIIANQIAKAQALSNILVSCRDACRMASSVIRKAVLFNKERVDKLESRIKLEDEMALAKGHQPPHWESIKNGKMQFQKGTKQEMMIPSSRQATGFQYTM